MIHLSAERVHRAKAGKYSPTAAAFAGKNQLYLR